MTSPAFELTEEEQVEIRRRAGVLHRLHDLGGGYPVGQFVVDYVQEAGVWVYHDKEIIYGDNFKNSHANFGNAALARELLDLLRTEMVLDDLADV